MIFLLKRIKLLHCTRCCHRAFELLRKFMEFYEGVVDHAHEELRGDIDRRFVRFCFLFFYFLEAGHKGPKICVQGFLIFREL